MAPPPQLHGRRFISGTPPSADNWTSRLQRLQGGVSELDPSMEIQPPPDAGRAMPDVPMENLTTMPGVEVSGWLPANVPATDPRYIEWLRLMRQRGAI